MNRCDIIPPTQPQTSVATLQDLFFKKRPNLKKKGQKRPTKFLKKAKHSSKNGQKMSNSSRNKAKLLNNLPPSNSDTHKNTSCVLRASTKSNCVKTIFRISHLRQKLFSLIQKHLNKSSLAEK